MCGIAGVVSLDPSSRDPLLLRKMLDALQHRGPDDEGLETRGPASLGARRLSIIDLVAGHQPMGNEDGSIIAVQNGELYNFVTLREELAALGHSFRTRNDTEILPHAYEEWGIALVERLRGMFAIAIWDEPRRTLFLARDRFGKKPLMYARTEDGLAFASEIQALLTHPAVSRTIDGEAIEAYLTYGYVPAPRTAFTAIRKLPAAHTLTFHVGGEPEIRRYWRLPFEPKLRISADEAAEEVRRRIDEAVRIRLMSDVPIGAFLSGGLDSSTVVAYMARHMSQPVKTFSIGFGDPAFDELGYARVVASAFGTDHNELVVDASDADILPLMVRHLGEPFADSSIVPTYHVARITRPHVTVALNGDGGDELFGGYPRYHAAAIARLTFDRIPLPLRKVAAGMARALPVRATAPRQLQRARRFGIGLGLTSEERHLRWVGYFTGPLRDRIAGPRLRLAAATSSHDLADAATVTGARDLRDQFMAADVERYLPDDLLVKMDIAAMANSLEGRSPLLDHELGEFVARLPVELKVSPRTSKILLRKAMRGILPPEILGRGKLGFTAPVGAWLRGPMRGLLGDLLLHPRAADLGYVDAAAVRGLFDEHQAGSVDRTGPLWTLLMLELWLREVAAAPDAAADLRSLARS